MFSFQEEKKKVKPHTLSSIQVFALLAKDRTDVISPKIEWWWFGGWCLCAFNWIKPSQRLSPFVT